MKSLALKIAFLLFGTGLIITLIVGYVERKTISTYDKYIPYVKLAEEVRNRTTQANLLLEDLLADNEALDFNADILPHFTTSINLLQAAYDGKETSLGNFVKPENEDVLAILKESGIQLDKLSLAAQERVAQKPEPIVTVDTLGNTHVQEVAEDPALKLQFSNQYNTLKTGLDRLSDSLENEMKQERGYVNLISWISIALLIVTFMGLTLLLYRMQRKNDNIVKENAERLAQQGEAVTSLSTFIESISAGNFAIDLHMEGDQGLTKILLNMRDKLRDNAEDDRKRNWATSGLAQIGEILRSHANSTEELYDNILRFVVKYTKSNQGGLFLLNEDEESDKYLSLEACYAFERKKYLQKKVVIGEGLVGQCFLEGERIYLVDVPQEYISITSGLGGANPNALLIIPLKVNEKIFGILELATFNKYEDYEIDLCEKLAESIASTISTVRVNESTRILLEKTQQQAEEMRAQEEEMRQNMEELEATQEEMRRKEKHIQVMQEVEKQRNEFNNQGRQVVLNLSKSKVLLEGRWRDATQAIVKAAGNHMPVSRTSIWTLDEVNKKICCEKLFLKDTQSFESGKEILESDAPDYFKALRREHPVMAKDALIHADTKELGDVYLRSANIQSVLNVPFLSDGKIAGFVSCEQQGDHIEWTEDHVEFLKSCADLITVTLNTVRINDMLDNLNEAQETLQTIIDNLPRAVFWKDRDLKIQGCNKIFAGVAGMKSHKEMIGKSDYEMPWSDRAEEYRADDQAVMDSKEARIDLEEKLVNSDGVESWVLTSKVPVLNQEGEVVAVLGMFEDITDRKRKEADIDAKLNELEQLKKMIEKNKN
ncbi:MAG TPA: GAF domain-containing protein [Ohtaekwangia sp.]|nr:GAF domain-containing protein [Ohtaekwangia sp.]